MSLPYLQQFGWKADILTVCPDYVEGLRDPLLIQTVPADIKITKTAALPVAFTHLFGLRNLGLRSLWNLFCEGNRLLASGDYELVFFSTTMFMVMTLGPVWRKRFGIPYLLDFQDPWLNDYYEQAGSPAPPGGRIKYGVARSLARIFEPRVLRHAAAVVSVSPEYPEMLVSRYPALSEKNFFILPFGAAVEDFSILAQAGIKQHMFDPQDGRAHWVYAGRGGGDMAFALYGLFNALCRARESHPERYAKVVLHFIGTDYTPGPAGKKTIEPVAIKCGVGDMVTEIPQRISYFEALKCLQDADALIVTGSNDPGYTASKIYPYILAQKPMLAIFHEHSSVVDVIRSTRSGTVVTFNTREPSEAVSRRITETWFNQYPPEPVSPDWHAFEKFTAREMTGSLCRIFDQTVQAGALT